MVVGTTVEISLIVPLQRKNVRFYLKKIFYKQYWIIISGPFKVIMQGKLIAVAYTLRTYWNQFSLDGICKQEYMHQRPITRICHWFFMWKMDPMWGFEIRLVFTLPPRDSTLQNKRCVHLRNNFPCIITLGRTISVYCILLSYKQFFNLQLQL